MRRDILLQIVLVLALVGLMVAGYQTYEHYWDTGPSGCDINERFSCSAVTESRYGELPHNSGIAVSAWGMLWWIGVIVLTYTLLQRRELVQDQEVYLFGMTGFGVLFAIYLISVELYFLPQITGQVTICPLCTAQHVLIALLLVIGYLLLDKPVREYAEELV